MPLKSRGQEAGPVPFGGEARQLLEAFFSISTKSVLLGRLRLGYLPRSPAKPRARGRGGLRTQEVLHLSFPLLLNRMSPERGLIDFYRALKSKGKCGGKILSIAAHTYPLGGHRGNRIYIVISACYLLPFLPRQFYCRGNTLVHIFQHVSYYSHCRSQKRQCAATRSSDLRLDWILICAHKLL